MSVRAGFVYQAQEDRLLKRSLPGYQDAAPVVVAQSQAAGKLEVILDRDEEAGMFDVLADRPAPIAVTLPGGRRVDQTSAGPGIEWTRIARGVPRSAGIISFDGFLQRGEGDHHLVSLETAAAGKYVFEIEPASGDPVAATLAFTPLGRVFGGLSDALNPRVTEEPRSTAMASQTASSPVNRWSWGFESGVR